MTSATVPPAVNAPAPAPSIQPAWKGAWGGAWTVLYGCVSILFGMWTVVTIDLGTTGTRYAAAWLRAHVPADADAEFVMRVATLIDDAPAAFGASLLGWTWAGVGLAAVVVIAGLGVIGRSALARRAAVVAVIASGLLSLGLLVWWALEVLPAYVAWRDAALAFEEDSRRRGGRSPFGFFGMLPGRGSQIASQGVSLAIQLVLIAALVRRLGGPAARAWCGGSGAGPQGPSKLPVASPGTRR